MKKITCNIHTCEGAKPITAHAFRDDRLPGAMLIVHHPLNANFEQQNDGWKVSEYTSGFGLGEWYGTKQEIIDKSINNAVKHLKHKSLKNFAKRQAITRGIEYPLNDPKTFPVER